jgi:DNA-binding CsgD family transcriptional regulator
MWLCPICGKRKKVLYCPLPPINVLRGVGCLIEDEVIDAALAHDPPPPREARGFGCVRCHGVCAFSRVSAGSWNAVVCYLSGGLLYGKEVPRPSWLTRERKRAYVPHPTMPLPRRPAEVQALLLKGMKYEQIGRELGITPKSAKTYAGKIYKQHGVHGRAELARKLGVPHEALMSKRARVHARVAMGQSTAQIASEAGIARDMVATYAYRFRRANGMVMTPRKREACAVRV